MDWNDDRPMGPSQMAAQLYRAHDTLRVRAIEDAIEAGNLGDWERALDRSNDALIYRQEADLVKRQAVEAGVWEE